MTHDLDADSARTIDEVIALIQPEISWRSRLAYLLLLFGSAGGASAVALLWATEPVPLPVRTRVAFAAIIAGMLAWSLFAGWTLVAGARPLYGRDRVIATTIGTAFAGATTVVSVLVAGARTGWFSTVTVAALVSGLALVAVASTLRMRARRRHRRLRARRDELEREVQAQVTRTSTS